MADTSRPWEQYRNDVTDGSAEDGPWRNYGGNSPAPSPTGGTLSDLGKSLKAGVQRLPGMATGLADLPVALATDALRVMAGLYWDLGAGQTPGKDEI